MSDPKWDPEVDALLGEGHLTGPAKDRVLDHVLAAAGRRPPGRWRPLSLAVGAAALAGAAALVLLVARPADRGDGLRAKGAANDGASVALSLSCSGGTLAACPRGATLIFGAGAAGRDEDGFLTAYADPRGGSPGRERIWYFSADTESPHVRVGASTEPFSRSIRIGPEHEPGEYTVHVLVTRAPQARAVLLGGAASGVIARRDFVLRVDGP